MRDQCLGAIKAIEGSIDKLTVPSRRRVVNSDSNFTSNPRSPMAPATAPELSRGRQNTSRAVGVNTLPLDASVEVDSIFSPETSLSYSRMI